VIDRPIWHVSGTGATCGHKVDPRQIERGETVTVTRGNRPIAEIRPAHRRTGRDLRAALAEIPPPDDAFERDVAEALTYVTSERTDPWADA
jgi:antitoxin (DNA-binding transcriptional repressor) of toxin-antitoxin stability system